MKFLSLFVSSHLLATRSTPSQRSSKHTRLFSSSTSSTSPSPSPSLMRTWDARYSMDGFAYGTEPNTFLKETVESVLDLPANASCLLLAEGEGRNAVYMATRGHCVFGVDSSVVGMTKAQALATSRGVQITTYVQDLADFDVGTNKWDCIIGIYCHVSPSIRKRILQAIPQALKSGGYAIFECYTPRQAEFHSGGPHSQDLLYTKEIFQQALGDSLQILLNQELVRTVLEGRYHTGDGAVVQFIGRKHS